MSGGERRSVVLLVVTEIMETQPSNCPSCGSEVKSEAIKMGKPFPCPSCGRLLRVSSSYRAIPGVASLLICAVLGYIFGLRPQTLFLFILVLWFPMVVFLGAILRVTLVPKLQEYEPDNLDLIRPN